jgi:hypothetical protein
MESVGFETESSGIFVKSFNSKLGYSQVECRIEDGGSLFLWNIDVYPWVHTMLQPRRPTLSCNISLENSFIFSVNWWMAFPVYVDSAWWKHCCSSLLWCHVDSYLDTNVSEKNTVSIFSPEDGDSIFLQNIGICIQVYMVSTQKNIIIFITLRASNLT